MSCRVALRQACGSGRSAGAPAPSCIAKRTGFREPAEKCLCISLHTFVPACGGPGVRARRERVGALADERLQGVLDAAVFEPGPWRSAASPPEAPKEHVSFSMSALGGGGAGRSLDQRTRASSAPQNSAQEALGVVVVQIHTSGAWCPTPSGSATELGPGSLPALPVLVAGCRRARSWVSGASCE